MSKRLLLLGGGGSIHKLPIEVVNYVDETWGVNNLYRKVQARWTRWFEIHRFDFLDGQWRRKTQNLWRGVRVTDYIKGLDGLGIPVYVQSLPSPFANARLFPLETVTKYRNFFGTTMSYQLALAIEEQFTEIHMYGIDLNTPGEYAEERPCVIYWVGVAEGRGIKVFIEGPLFKKDYFYGYNIKSEEQYEKDLGLRAA